MDDFDDFDNELDDILKNVIEEGESKKPPTATPSKPSARISLFDDEPKIIQGESSAPKENTFLAALFGSSVSTARATPQDAQRTSQVANSSQPPKVQNDVDPLDAILSRTKARKAAMQNQRQAQDKTQSGSMQSSTDTPEKNRTAQTLPKPTIEERLAATAHSPRQDYSDYSFDSEDEAVLPPRIVQKEDQARETPRQEEKPARQKGTRGGLLDVDSLAGLNIKKSVDRKPRESDNAPSAEAEPASINAHQGTAAAGAVNVVPAAEANFVAFAQKEVSKREYRAKTESEAQRINIEVDGLVKRYEDQMKVLQGQLEQQQQLLSLKEEEIQRIQDSKTANWQSEIEQKLEKLSTEQSSFLETIRDGFTDMKKQVLEEFELRKLQDEQRTASENQIKLEQEQTRERFEIEIREKYEQMVDRINRANSLVVSKMKSEHERELMIVEKTKQQEIDQVTGAFDQTRSLRDLSNRILNLVNRLESLQHSLMSEFCEKMEKRLQMMERKIMSGPARVDELAQRLSIVTDKATEAHDETRSEVSRLRKELRGFVDEQEDFRHMLLREHRGLVAQIVADRNIVPSFSAAQAGSDGRSRAFLSSWEEELARRGKLTELARSGETKSSRVPSQSTNAAISQAMFIWRSYQQENL